MKSRFSNTMAMVLLLGTTAFLPISSSKADDLAVYFTTSDVNINENVVDLVHTNPAGAGALGYLPQPQSLEIYSQNNGTKYYVDSRATNDFSTFYLYLSADSSGSSTTTTNDSLWFFFNERDSNINYVATINIPSNYTSSGSALTLTTNVTDGLNIPLPGIQRLPNNAVYGTINVIPFVPPTTNAPPTIDSFSASATNATIAASAYSSGTVTPQYSPAMQPASWADVSNSAQFVNTGISNLTFSVPITSTTQGFYRLGESIMQ